MVQQKESQRSAMVHLSSQDYSALVVITTPSNKKPGQTKSGSKGSSIDCDLSKCDYSRKERHDKQHYWKLNGHPTWGLTWWTSASTSGNTNALSQDEVLTLQHLIARFNTLTPIASTSSSNFAYTSILVSVLGTYSNRFFWYFLFLHYIPCSGKDKVRAADGFCPLYLGRVLFTDLQKFLSSILHVPMFLTNLPSVNSAAPP